MNPVNVSDFRVLAKQTLSKSIFEFIDGGACDEITKENNRAALDSISLRPLCLRDVSKIDTTVTLLGSKHASPIMIAPTAFHQLVNQDGEISTAKAAKLCNCSMVVSCMSNRSFEEIAEQSLHHQLWAQLYIFKKRALTETLIRRAEEAGFKAIVLTVGVPRSGKRERDLRNQFSLQLPLTTANFKSTVNDKVIYDFTAEELDPSLTWHDIEWLKTKTQLPIVLKGILNPLDVEEACRLEVSGIVVSNHGGRQLDTAEAAIKVLPDLVKVAAGRTTVLIDGAIQRGTDILKAIALGADAILIGRPVLWALAVNGTEGVLSMLTVLKDEFEMAMKLTGCRTVQEIKKYSSSIMVSPYDL
ncbi:alpha-hydroxy acid oxidase [Legionella shakespearei]|uniref:FMN-dependent dehydrogenase n=1 Tax=Legionella shakespearei DSM 23087 TaxID=1122169 RepID=A0A0W0YZQ1_9GAMM|nr:alpha-hydroxy acid oxidase [Legionella shakespearei]KTD62357.1 FMN-dependent dehydrogenase [Legionella shakespearei DSM 23087]